MMVSPVICPRIRSNSIFIICKTSPRAAILVAITGILKLIPFGFEDQHIQEYLTVSLFIFLSLRFLQYRYLFLFRMHFIELHTPHKIKDY